MSNYQRLVKLSTTLGYAIRITADKGVERIAVENSEGFIRKAFTSKFDDVAPVTGIENACAMLLEDIKDQFAKEAQAGEGSDES